jgi:hypothetical protein
MSLSIYHQKASDKHKKLTPNFWSSAVLMSSFLPSSRLQSQNFCRIPCSLTQIKCKPPFHLRRVRTPDKRKHTWDLKTSNDCMVVLFFGSNFARLRLQSESRANSVTSPYLDNTFPKQKEDSENNFSLLSSL